MALLVHYYSYNGVVYGLSDPECGCGHEHGLLTETACELVAVLRRRFLARLSDSGLVTPVVAQTETAYLGLVCLLVRAESQLHSLPLTMDLYGTIARRASLSLSFSTVALIITSTY